MTKLDDRTIAKMDLALEQACRVFSHGGDHERRRYVAQKLKLSARKGNITLDGLIVVANAAVDELSRAEKIENASGLKLVGNRPSRLPEGRDERGTPDRRPVRRTSESTG